MRVLVTGHLGYIGPVMVRLFKEAGHHVTGLDIGYFRECITPGENLVAPDKEIVRDLRDIQLSDVKNIDVVVHLAALSNDPMGQLDEQLTYTINHKCSVDLATLAKKAGVERFIFASSCSIYGAAADNYAPLDEQAMFNPVSAYAHSKVNTERDVQKLADASFSPIFLRNATAYGVSPRMRFDLVLNNLMAWAKTTGSIKVMSDGSPWRPLVHIEDISRAAVAAAEAPRDLIHNQAFNIGRNDANYQVRDIAEAVTEMVPNAKLEILGESGGDTRSYKVSFDKVHQTLEYFKPQWTLQKGCVELQNWFDEGKLQNRTFDSRFFIRLEQLKYLMEKGSIDEKLRFKNTD